MGQRVRARRLMLNVSAQELAERVGVSDKTLRNLEQTGRCTLETFVRVLETLNALPDLEPVLQPATTSIDQMRQQAAAKQRKRASSPRKSRVAAGGLVGNCH